MDNTDFYFTLITSEHRHAPRFEGVVRALTKALADNVDLGLSLLDMFDLNTATGDQLDIIGKWVGISRTVQVPITGVYFTWDGTTTTGWERGVWKGPFDPPTGPSSVDDGTYRLMIRAKIAANCWDGTFESMCSQLDAVFGSGLVKAQDNQDMSITLYYDDMALSAVMVSLLTQGILELKPMGVRFIYQAVTGAPIFSWNVMTPRYQGWNGVSVWV